MSLYRFTSHEVKLEIDCLQEIIGMRVGNIHQIDKDTIIIKFWKLGCSRNLIIENGIRFHLTDFPHEKPKTPPDFCCRLRKWLRFRRLDDIIQPGNDRAVYFCFGDLRLCLELFQAGNIILFQASDLKIVAVLRFHVIQGKTVIGVNQPYIAEQFRDYVPPTDEQVHAFFRDMKPDKPGQKLRTHLSKLYWFHRGEFFTHAMTLAGITPIEMKVEDFVYDEEKVNKFIEAIRPFDEILLSKPPPRPPRPPMNEDGTRPEPPEQPDVPIIPKAPGYVYAPKPKEKFLCGVQLAHWNPKFVQKFDVFDAACDNMWSVEELQKAQKERQQIEKIPERKVQSVKRNFDKKKKELQGQLDNLNKTGALIQKWAEEVEQCRMILNSFISQHLKWDDIRKSIRAYQESGDELARMIDKVEFEKGMFWVLLTTDEGDIERVLIDLRKSAHANASAYFNKRGAISEKLSRTEEKETSVIKKVDKEAHAVKQKSQMTIQERRKTWWFERFHWFITSENYLVIAGRDKIQNDVLVKHYLKKDDIYLHAEIHGAASVILKNPTGRPVSPISLEQAAEFAVSRSTAWKTNEPCTCFWVHAWQVKKNLPGQPPAPTGAFYIVGEKNNTTMTMPQMAIGVLFHVTEEHVAKHSEERRIRVDEDALKEEGQPQPEEEPQPIAPVKRITSDELNQELPFPTQPEPAEEAPPEVESEDSGEEEDEEEELTDAELARIALEQPERADVAERRLKRREKRNRPKPKPAPLEEGVKEVMENEGFDVDIDVEGINALTGEPRADDEFYAAYTMVAPMSALLNFKFRIKFVPGETKKGKAWPLMQQYFTSIKGTPAEQVALMRMIPESDVINQLPFNIRLSLGAGGSAMQNKGKNKGKKGKKGKKK